MLRHLPSRLLVGLLGAQLQLSWPGVARAEPEGGAQTAPAMVRVVLAGAEGRVTALQAALLDPFRRAHIELAFERAPSIRPALWLTPAPADDLSSAALAFDLSSPEKATLYLTDRERSRIFVRRFQIQGTFDEVTLERLVIAARTSVEAILAGQSIGVGRQEYERSLHEPQAPVRPASPAVRHAVPNRSSSIASRYEVEWLAGAAPSHGPGLVALLDRGWFAFGGGIGGRLPWRFTEGDIGVRLLTFNFLLLAEVQHDFARNWLISAGIGAGLDVTQVQPLALRAGSTDIPGSSWRLDPLARAQCSIVHSWPSVWLGGGGGLDLDFVRARYTLDRDGKRETVLTPHVLRPLLAISFGTSW